ncbi:hypothetical protein AUK40_04675 [Candidatus Wirthbacteria bacterium CG2_30_54_11]|uniref:Restriction endonuclease n=1 Tax=Candidatus Wirthbacteria bacterium CG2_30_54_11 TaxID=1817892 RepID=A0A1J5IHX4_9BACT|nr:MAG: hypothetical protein AUK40_04675 [Candidatus Wirthbacteria bacterium CG2_30_54_11]
MNSLTAKQYQRYQTVARSSLKKFQKLIGKNVQDSPYQEIVRSWEQFINDENKFKNLIESVSNVESLLGFSSELSNKLSNTALVERVSQRYAEVDLAIHALREFRLNTKENKLEKNIEGQKKQCDFQYIGNPSYYFESKFTTNISPKHIKDLTEKALAQLQSSIGDQSNSIGYVWIFSYKIPLDIVKFQTEIENIKRELNTIGFNFKLTVQIYGLALYDDGDT